MTVLHLDYEGRSVVELKTHGLDRYSSDPSTEVLMCAYAFDHDTPTLWTPDQPFPKDVREALLDPEVEKWAFNAQFERIITRRVMKIKTPVKGWRCTMALAFMQSFAGTLDQIGHLVGLPSDKQKLAIGKKLIGKFCKPQRITKNQPYLWRDEFTDPDDWALFKEYCLQDVVAERAIKSRLIKYPIPPSEWELYELDQIINDRGLPVDYQFTRNAYQMAVRRKAELTEELKDETGLPNPNSPAQLLPWLRERGYWFNDLQKATIKKVLAENEEIEERLTPEAVSVLKKRQVASKTTPTKLKALLDRMGADGNIRFTFQFAGAQRTQRWAGRGFQPHNLARPGKKTSALLDELREAVKQEEYEWFRTLANEPIISVSESVRAAISCPDDGDEELRVADLSAIETCVTAWLSRCSRLLKVIRDGGDPYKDFGSDLYQKAYDEITKDERQNSKPAVLGCTYRLGGGELKEGKRTGLWGYAESMGVNQTKEESHRQVKVFRRAYPEIPKLWYALEEAVKTCIQTGRTVTPKFSIDGRRVEVPVTFEMRHPYLCAILPILDPETGERRRLYYHKPRISKKTFQGKDGPYEKEVFSYMGTAPNSRAWVRVFSHGGKITENLVQAIARDVLKWGLLRAAADGFRIIGHVHDEIITRCRRGDNYYTVARLIELMSQALHGAEDLPLAAAGYSNPFYKKD